VSDAEPDVVVTGMGAVSALGRDCAALWASVAEGRCGIQPIRRFSTDGFRVCTGALVETADARPPGVEATEWLCRTFSETAAAEALAAAALASACGGRVAFVFGTGIAERSGRVHELTEQIAAALRIAGPCITVCTACSSSTAAIGFGRELLAAGAADVVLAGGADVLTPEVFAGFHALGVLTSGRCAPFSTPPGTTLGEGAGFIVLERRAHAEARGAGVIATLSGFGLSGDGWHETAPDPKGTGVERAIRSALHDAGIVGNDVAYVNAHGSGTEANDPAEWLGVQRALGPQAAPVPVSSTKGALGHAQGAAGVLELIVTLLAAQRERIPPTLNYTGARRVGPPDPVGDVVPRPHRWQHALAINSAFGGANAALVLSRGGRARPGRQRRRVAVLGAGVMVAGEVPSAATPSGNGTRVADGPLSTEAVIRRLVPGADARGLDPSSGLLTAAAALALRDAGVAIRGALRDRTGLLVGQTRASPASSAQFRHSIDTRGLLQLSASAFARVVLNAPAGFCSKLLSLRGPLSVVTTGPGSGLTALTLGTWLAAGRVDVDLMVVGACDERDVDAGEAVRWPDSAACLLLGGEGALPHGSGPVRAWIAGCGVAAAGDVDEAVARALSGSGVEAHGIPVFCGERDDHGPAAAALFAVMDGLAAVAAGERHALVTCAAGNSVATAILLEEPGAHDEHAAA
jgi:3-oxoacyl-[acyl-carrier-protein] synthase II